MANSTDYCTLSTCPLSLSKTGYVPNLGGNVFFAAWFTALLVAQLVLSIRFRTFSFLTGQLFGLALEIISYGARISLHYNPFKQGPFLAYGTTYLEFFPPLTLACRYIVPNTVAPAFICFTIYLCFGRVVLVFGKEISRIPYRAYTLTFVTLDVLCLVLQAAGAAGTQNTSSPDHAKMSLKILKAGLGLQVAGLTVFLLLALEFSFQAAKRRDKWSNEYDGIRSSATFRVFILSEQEPPFSHKVSKLTTP